MDDIGGYSKIKSLTVKDFTAFSETTLNFSDLNVIVGENGVGKTHLLKLPYAILASCQRPGGRPTSNEGSSGSDVTRGRPTAAALEPTLSKKLVGVFRPKKQRVGRLVRRRQGYNTCSVKLKLADEAASIKFGFSTRSSKVNITACPNVWNNSLPVFLPTHELLSLPPGFIWLYDRYATEFDETWYDTRKLLGAPSLRGRPNAYADVDNLLKDVIGGTVTYNKNDEHFYLRQRDGLLEMLLVAEGLRKVGMLSHLIATGQMGNVNYLFWDEPESNLNPKIMLTVADAISRISRSGTQVFVATHNLFLLKELELIQHKNSEKRYLRYFALEQDGDGVAVNQADDIYDIDPLVALEETNKQSDRFAVESQK